MSHLLPQARFVQDVNMGDRAGTMLSPGQKFTKVWRMRNEGSSAWSENTILAFVGGDQLGAPEAVVVPPIVAGEETDISVEMVAPNVPGRYVSYWRLCTPEGQRFGHRVWVDVIVRDQAPEPMSVPEPQPESREPAHEPVEPAPAPPADLMDSTAALEQEFEQMHIPPAAAAEPTFISEPVPPAALEMPLIPEPAEPAVSVEPAAPLYPEVSLDTVEGQSIKTLRDMGFEGDLLTVLRRNRGDLMEAVRELLGN